MAVVSGPATQVGRAAQVSLGGPMHVSLRRPALDGLRGLAALTVVISHSLLVAPPLADRYTAGSPARMFTWPWFLTYTPLHIFWAGGEAVLVFFVLSGLVLALPSAAGHRGGWRSYYPQRLLRLYLPIFAAASLAFALVRAVPRHPAASSSWWLAMHRSPVGLHEALRDAVVVMGSSGMNPAFWSLQWEVYFSCLLPVFLFVLLRFRRGVFLRAAALLALVALGTRTNHLSLVYLPIFGLGVVMAQQMPWLDGVGERFGQLRPELRRDVVMGVGLLLVARWWITVLPYTKYSLAVGTALTVLGACLLVWLFSSTHAGRTFGERRVCRWLGARSFSLYLVHEPIVVTVAYLLHGTTNGILVLVLALPLSLVAAELFGRMVEVPSHRLARAVGRRLQGPVPL